MKFMHIAPTKYMSMLRWDQQLLLAHLIDEDKDYAAAAGVGPRHPDSLVNAAIGVPDSYPQKTEGRIMDNSAFEMYQRGLPMFDPQKLMELGDRCGAATLVLPDYPGEAGRKTIDAAKQYIPLFKERRFETFFVPQSIVGDTEDYIDTFAWAAIQPGVDVIGVSCIGVPNAFGVYNNPVQQYNARAEMLRILEYRGILDLVERNGKRLHILGMLDGPNEIRLLAPWIASGLIGSWDSSAAVWAAINGIEFDNTPTGLRDGKIKSHVDFAFVPSDEVEDYKIRGLISKNRNYINQLVREAKQ